MLAIKAAISRLFDYLDPVAATVIGIPNALNNPSKRPRRVRIYRTSYSRNPWLPWRVSCDGELRTCARSFEEACNIAAEWGAL